jgi:hypothetical protein
LVDTSEGMTINTHIISVTFTLKEGRNGRLIGTLEGNSKNFIIMTLIFKEDRNDELVGTSYSL